MSAAGVKSNAADFERDNSEYLSLASSAALQMSSSDIYVGAWIKAETLVSYPNIISKLGPDGGREFNLRVLPTGVVDFTVYDGSNANYTTASKIATITLGQWYYVEGWTDKANRTVYVNINNGTPASATWAAGINRNGAGSSPLLIGARAALDGGIGEYWDGLIDEAVYYKRGLNASERTWLYNNGAGRIYSELTPLSGNALNYSYTGAHAHAVTALGTANSYEYDANGNMTCRVEDGVTYKQDYDAENRLTKVQKLSGDCTTGTAVDTTQFVYDGDGNRVKSFMGNTTTVFVGNYFEATTIDQTTTFTKYYFAGTQRVAMRKYTIPQPMTVEYMLGDHLGSTSITADSNGARISEIRYNPWGEMRAWWTSGEATTPGYKLINYTFTGQYSYMDDPTTGAIEGFGLMFYNARFYSPYINHFIQPDTIIPEQSNPQSWNRYSYVNNNPLRYTDPTGHRQCENSEDSCISEKQITAAETIKHEKFKLANQIHEKFNNVTISNPSAWLIRDLNEIEYGLYQINNIYGFDGNTDAMSAAFGNVTFASAYIPGDDVGYATWSTGLIQLEADGATADTVIHEMGHILDGSLNRLNSHVPLYSSTNASTFDAGSGATQYARDKNSPKEDFADSFLAVIKYGFAASQHVSEPRITAINAVIQGYTYPDHSISPGR